MGSGGRPLPIRRKRTGCWNCKGQKRKCSEEQPSCNRCLRRGVVCQYGIRLQWEDETRNAGMAFGRATRDNGIPDTGHHLLPIPQGQMEWLHTTAQEVQQYHQGYAVKQTALPPHMSAWSREPSPSRPLSVYPTLDHDSTLLQYYTEEWSRHRVLSQTSENPFQRYVLSSARHSSPLLHAILSLAAHDLFSRTTVDQQDRRRGLYFSMLKHKVQSLQDVRLVLNPGKGPDHFCNLMSQYDRDSLLMTVMLHSLMEITTISTSEWSVHALGGLFMIKQYGHNPFSDEVYRFVTDHFSLSEALLSTTGPGLQIEDLNDWLIPERISMFPTLRSMHGRSQINPYTGLSSELLLNISWITSIVQRQTQLRPQTGSTIAMSMELQIIESRLRLLEQWSDDTGPGSLMHLNATAFEAATWAYLRVVQFGCKAEGVQENSVPQLFEAIHQVHVKHGALLGLRPYPLWALFIAACLAPEKDRVRVLKWFKELIGNRSLSNATAVMQAVMVIWKQNDLRLISGRSNRIKNSAVPWHEPIQGLGLMLSLI